MRLNRAFEAARYAGIGGRAAQDCEGWGESNGECEGWEIARGEGLRREQGAGGAF